MDQIKKFDLERREYIRRIAGSKKLEKLAIDFFIESWKLKYSYNFDWLGLPIIQYPQDIVAIQEIIWSVKPELIIETGIARGGSLIFYASMLELLGRGGVVGIDIDIREHNRKVIEKHKMAKRITMIEKSSIDPQTVRRVRQIAKRYKKVLVCLDSSHSHNHVLRELELYSPFVTRGSYLVVFDTIVECMPKGAVKNRPWDKGNNPKTAVSEFLETHEDFIIDHNVERKIAITSAPGGYLKRIQ